MKELYAIINKNPDTFHDHTHKDLTICSKAESTGELAIFQSDEWEKAVKERKKLEEEYNHNQFQVVNLTVEKFYEVVETERETEQGLFYLGKAIDKFQNGMKHDVAKILEIIKLELENDSTQLVDKIKEKIDGIDRWSQIAELKKLTDSERKVSKREMV